MKAILEKHLTKYLRIDNIITECEGNIRNKLEYSSLKIELIEWLGEEEK